MAAESSAYESAPDRDISPPTTQTTNTMPGVPTLRIIVFGTMKIPLPITVPTTIATALQMPRSRLSEYSFIAQGVLSTAWLGRSSICPTRWRRSMTCGDFSHLTVPATHDRRNVSDREGD